MILIEVRELDSGDIQYVNVNSIDRIIPKSQHKTYISVSTMVGGIYVEESIGEILKLIRIAHDKDIRDYCKEKEDLWWHKMDKHNEDW
jgi:hypothetical protein